MDIIQGLVIGGSIVAGLFAIDRAHEDDRVELNCDYVAEHPHLTVPPSNKCEEKKEQGE